MKEQLELKHTEMLSRLELNWILDSPVSERIEDGYHIAMEYWMKVKEVYLSGAAISDEEEIYFFRELKSLFTAHIEYYLILNQVLLFVPSDPEEILLYWTEETRRFQRYREKHSDFIGYYESGSTAHDNDYFLMRNNRQEMPPQERIYEDADCRSSHDHIVRGLVAHKMYHAFVEEQLKPLQHVAPER